jgi:hypothetical protein
MKIRTVKLSSTEQYACTEQDVRYLFPNDDAIFISFGYLGKTFTFESSMKKQPSIQGLIICSCSINHRLSAPTMNAYLSFYVIRDLQYAIKGKDIFVNSILPQIHDWYLQAKIVKNTSVPGMAELIVEWTGSACKIHYLNFV